MVRIDLLKSMVIIFNSILRGIFMFGEKEEMWRNLRLIKDRF